MEHYTRSRGCARRSTRASLRSAAAAQRRDQTTHEGRRHLPERGPAITRLVGVILLEQNDEWTVQQARYMTGETMTEMLEPPAIHLPAVAG